MLCLVRRAKDHDTHNRRFRLLPGCGHRALYRFALHVRSTRSGAPDFHRFRGGRIRRRPRTSSSRSSHLKRCRSRRCTAPWLISRHPFQWARGTYLVLGGRGGRGRISYLGGVTAALSHAFQHGSNLLPYLCLSFPVHGRLRPVVGIGDLVVITAVYLALRRLGHNGLLAFTGPFAGLALALAIGLLIGGVFAIPFIAATTSAYLWFVRARPPSSAPSSAREAPTGGHA